MFRKLNIYVYHYSLKILYIHILVNLVNIIGYYIIKNGTFNMYDNVNFTFIIISYTCRI